MAQEWDTTAKNAMLDHVASLCTRLAFHSGDPGAANTASNEVGERQPVSFNASANGTMDVDGTPETPIDADTTVSWISGWNTGGTVRYFKKPVDPEAFTNAGIYRVLEGDLDLNNDPV